MDAPPPDPVSPSRQSSAVGALVVSGILVVVGWAGLCFGAASPAGWSAVARTWPEAECTITDSRLVREAEPNGRPGEPSFVVAYTVESPAPAVPTGDAVGVGFDLFGPSAPALRERYPLGARTRCWAGPSGAVLDRSLPLLSIVAVLLVFGPAAMLGQTGLAVGRRLLRPD